MMTGEAKVVGEITRLTSLHAQDVARIAELEAENGALGEMLSDHVGIVERLEAEVARWREDSDEAREARDYHYARVTALEDALRPTAMSFHRLAKHPERWGSLRECQHPECALNRAALADSPPEGRARGVYIRGKPGCLACLKEAGFAGAKWCLSCLLSLARTLAPSLWKPPCPECVNGQIVVSSGKGPATTSHYEPCPSCTGEGE